MYSNLKQTKKMTRIQYVDELLRRQLVPQFEAVCQGQRSQQEETKRRMRNFRSFSLSEAVHFVPENYKLSLTKLNVISEMVGSLLERSLTFLFYF